MNERELIYAVEDDLGIGELYQAALEQDYAVMVFADGKSFFEAFAAKKPDLVLLDIMLPDVDGYRILTEIRASDELLPVIVVSAKSDEISLVKGLNRGADDYITKPFSVLELIARVKAALRRANAPIKRVEDFVVDANAFSASYCGVELGLTKKEFLLLKALISRAGVTLERERLLSDIWGVEFVGETRTLDMHVASLRDKIHKAGGGDFIVTVRGVGYRFEQ